MLQTVHFIVSVLAFMILVRCILSWIPDTRRRFREIADAIDAVTDPILKPLQLLLPPRTTGGLDFSPILAIFILQLIERVIIQMLR